MTIETGNTVNVSEEMSLELRKRNEVYFKQLRSELEGADRIEDDLVREFPLEGGLLRLSARHPQEVIVTFSIEGEHEYYSLRPEGLFFMMISVPANSLDLKSGIILDIPQRLPISSEAHHFRGEAFQRFFDQAKVIAERVNSVTEGLNNAGN